MTVDFMRVDWKFRTNESNDKSLLHNRKNVKLHILFLFLSFISFINSFYILSYFKIVFLIFSILPQMYKKKY